MRTARTLGMRLSGESPTDAIAVNQLITKMNPKTPKNILNACASIGPYPMRTANAMTLKRRMTETDMPVRIAKKLSKSRGDGCRTSAPSQGSMYVRATCQPPVAHRRS